MELPLAPKRCTRGAPGLGAAWARWCPAVPCSFAPGFGVKIRAEHLLGHRISAWERRAREHPELAPSSTFPGRSPRISGVQQSAAGAGQPAPLPLIPPG